VKEALNWSPPYGNDSAAATLPALSSGMVAPEMEFTRVECQAELWRICGSRDPVDFDQTEETLVGQVGGTAIARTALLAILVESTPSDPDDPGGDPYFDDDDEAPV
jgi:hypothetical protein